MTPAERAILAEFKTEGCLPCRERNMAREIAKLRQRIDDACAMRTPPQTCDGENGDEVRAWEDAYGQALEDVRDVLKPRVIAVTAPVIAATASIAALGLRVNADGALTDTGEGDEVGAAVGPC